MLLVFISTTSLLLDWIFRIVPCITPPEASLSSNLLHEDQDELCNLIRYGIEREIARIEGVDFGTSQR